VTAFIDLDKYVSHTTFSFLT